MKNTIILTIIGMLLLAPMKTTQAQEPGSGGTIVVGSNSFGYYGTTTLDSLNPLRSGFDSVTLLMFPRVVGTSPFTQYYGKVGEEGVYGALATDWTISENGLLYTFTLRRDAVWSDGTPITAVDVKFSFDAIASGQIESVLYGTYNYEPDDNPFGIKEIVVLDDYTVQAVFKEANCEALGLVTFPIVPAHVFGYDGRPDFDFSVIIGHAFDTRPPAVYGPFQLDYLHYGEELALKPVATWTDGPVIPAGIIFRDTSGPEDETARFLAGELDYIENPQSCPTCITDIRAAPDVKAVSFPSNIWPFIGLNVADPDHPQPGLDADGNLIDQGHHPIFGDVQVRRALQRAIDVQAIIQAAVNGEGTQMVSILIPTSWAADPDLAPVPYDPEAAAQLLDEAGWPIGPDGVRVCQGCKYALDGTPFVFELVTNEGQLSREVVGTMVKDQLREVGIEVDFQTMDFLELVADAQTYDAYMIGWFAGFPDDPDRTGLFDPRNDLPFSVDSDVNSTSYYNPEFVRLSEKALTLPGCDPTVRADIYHQIERLLQDDQPYVWLFSINQFYAAHDNVIGFDPQPNAPWWNIHTWRVERP
jgi:peptide/nickel transport system substrate-binding protein